MRFRRVIASHRDPAVAIGLHCLDAGSGRAIDGQACPVTAQPGAPVPYFMAWRLRCKPDKGFPPSGGVLTCA